MVNAPDRATDAAIPSASPASMTGFASARGVIGDWDWAWEVRSVNGRGLDLRVRVPDWLDGLEAAARAAVQGRIARGNVTLSLRLTRRSGGGAAGLDAALLHSVIAALAEVERAAEAAGVTLQHSSAADLLGLKGMLDGNAETTDPAALSRQLSAALPALLTEFETMRRAEGVQLAAVIEAQLSRIDELARDAAALAADRREAAAETLRGNLARVLQNSDGADPDRVAQELALLAVKADVTEEIDRLAAHVAAGRALLAESGPIGRRLDFLTQEFMREANTLCSKSGSAELTRAGLDLKAVIDQMREQVQNVE